MTPQEATDAIRRVGVEPTEKLVDQFIWAYYKGKTDSTKTPRIGYMCRTDFDIELFFQQDAEVYGSIDLLKKSKECTHECGIVKVGVTELEIVETGSLHKR